LAREEGPLNVDGAVLLRRARLTIMSRVLTRLGQQVTEEAAATGLVVQHRQPIEVACVFGPVTVESPYLSADSRSARLVNDVLG
jgi:hypothetical protein